jgi:hypothetical protein
LSVSETTQDLFNCLWRGAIKIDNRLINIVIPARIAEIQKPRMARVAVPERFYMKNLRVRTQFTSL